MLVGSWKNSFVEVTDYSKKAHTDLGAGGGGGSGDVGTNLLLSNGLSSVLFSVKFLPWFNFTTSECGGSGAADSDRMTLG